MTLYDGWIANWTRIASGVEATGGEVQELALSPAADEAAVLEVERQLGARLPEELRALFTSLAGSVRFAWRFRVHPPVNMPVRRLGGGEITWDLEELVGLEASRQGWAELYDAPDEAPIWARKLVFQRMANGDLLAIDLDTPSHPVVYLDHDGDSLHGRVLASGFNEFVSRWTLVGCAGPEWWELKPFLDENGLDPTGPGAVVWQDWLDSALRGTA